MPSGYTSDIYSGSDLNIDHFILGIAFGTRFFEDVERKNIYSREFVKKHIDSNYTINSVEDYKNALKFKKGVDTLFDRLPHITIELEEIPEKKRSHFELYPKAVYDSVKQYEVDYKGTSDIKDKLRTTYKEKVYKQKLLEAKITYLKGLTVEEKQTIFEQYKSEKISECESDIKSDEVLAKRYDRAIEVVQSLDVSGESEEFLTNVKKYALEQLQGSRDFDCSSKYYEHELQRVQNLTLDELFDRQLDWNEKEYEEVSAEVKEFEDAGMGEE